MILWFIEKQSIYERSFMNENSCVHWNAVVAWWFSDESLRTMIALILPRIKVQSNRTGFTNVSLIIMYWFISWTNAILIFFIPYCIIRTALTHFVLLIIFWWPSWTFSTLFIDFVKVLIFIWVTVIICLMFLMQGLHNCEKQEKRKYFFIHLNKNYIWNLIWMLLEK